MELFKGKIQEAIKIISQNITECWQVMSSMEARKNKKV